IDAALARCLSVCIQRLTAQVKLREIRAIGLRLGVGCLTADQGQVVTQAPMRDSVVLSQQGSLGRQYVGQVGRRRRLAERDRVRLILEQQNEYVPDSRQACARRWCGTRLPATRLVR